MRAIDDRPHVIDSLSELNDIDPIGSELLLYFQ